MYRMLKRGREELLLPSSSGVSKELLESIAGAIHNLCQNDDRNAALASAPPVPPP